MRELHVGQAPGLPTIEVAQGVKLHIREKQFQDITKQQFEQCWLDGKAEHGTIFFRCHNAR